MEGEGGEAEPKPGAARQCPLKQVISVKTWDGEARRPVGDAGIVLQLVSEIGDEHNDSWGLQCPDWTHDS